MTEPMFDFVKMLWLFSSTKSSRGAAQLNIAEAGLLWRIARESELGAVQLGAGFGGGACLIVSALEDSVPFTLIDYNLFLSPECRKFLDLAREDRGQQITLNMGSTHTQRPSHPCDLLFLDAEHSYDGLKATFDHARTYLAPRAVIAFHDAVSRSAGGREGMLQLTQELIKSKEIEEITNADSLSVCRWLGKK